MSEGSDSWVHSLFRNTSYQLLNDSESAPPELPGAYVEGVTPIRNRASLNSHTLHNARRQVIRWFNILIIVPIIRLMILCSRIIAKLINVVYFKDQYSTQHSSYSPDPIDRAGNFIRSMEDNLAPEQLSNSHHLPPFFEGSFTQALYMATNRAKFLFVYLTNTQNENSLHLFKKVITNPEFISLFSKNPELIIWGGELENSEACQLANSLRVTKFPFLGLLCLTRTTTMSPQGPIKTPSKISLISKLQGGFSDGVDANELIVNKFQKSIENYEGELSLIRNELRDKFVSQVLMKQQDIIFQKTLERDARKKQEKLYDKTKKEYLSYKAQYFKQISQENTEGKAKIAIKQKDGSRSTFYFPADDPVQSLFVYVELYNGGYLEDSDFSTPSFNYDDSKFKNFSLEYKFKLTSPLPPRISLNDHLKKKIREMDSIYPNGVLIVEDL